MTITVEQKHIDNADPGSAFGCPVARAARDAGLVDAFVLSRLYWAGRARQAELPEWVLDTILAFDAGEPIAPFSFELDVKG